MRTAIVLCVLAVAMAGCGAGATDSSTEFDGEERAVARTLEDLEEAGRDGEEQNICRELFSETLLAALKKQGTNCTTAVREALEDTDAFELKVEDVSISGTTATAKVKSGRSGSDQKDDTITLEKQGQTWKIVSLSA